MKKNPTLYQRVYEGRRVVGVTEDVTEGCERVASGEGVATVKMDGSCCAVINGEFYKRYDAKHGKPVPEGAVRCQEEPDPVTGHLPCWVKVDPEDKSDKWFLAAYNDAKNENNKLEDGTYEAIGVHFQGNPYKLDKDTLVKHGEKVVENVGRSKEELFAFLSENDLEGLVFWIDGEPVCKIKKSDFGLKWR